MALNIENIIAEVKEAVMNWTTLAKYEENSTAAAHVAVNALVLLTQVSAKDSFDIRLTSARRESQR